VKKKRKMMKALDMVRSMSDCGLQDEYTNEITDECLKTPSDKTKKKLKRS
jgi:hypothetical protein